MVEKEDALSSYSTLKFKFDSGALTKGETDRQLEFAPSPASTAWESKHLAQRSPDVLEHGRHACPARPPQAHVDTAALPMPYAVGAAVTTPNMSGTPTRPRHSPVIRSTGQVDGMGRSAETAASFWFVRAAW